VCLNPDNEKPLMFGRFQLVGANATSCPDKFVVIGNASDYSAAVQRTICRKRSPREDDLALWERVLATSRAIDMRQNRNDPWGGTHGGLIKCHYESNQVDEDLRADDLVNFKRLLFRLVENDKEDWRVRDYASELLIQMAFGAAQDSTHTTRVQ